MKQGDAIFIDDLRFKMDDESRKILFGTIRHISENPPYTNIYLDTGYQITIKKNE